MVSALATGTPCSQCLVAHHRDNWGANASQVSVAKVQEAKTQWLALCCVTWIKHSQIITRFKKKNGIPGLFQKKLMSVGATTFWLVHELTHRKHYGSKMSNPFMSHSTRLGTKGIWHFSEPCCLFWWQSHSLFWKLHPTSLAKLGRALGSRQPTGSCMGQPPPGPVPSSKRGRVVASRGLVNPQSTAWTITIFMACVCTTATASRVWSHWTIGVGSA